MNYGRCICIAYVSLACVECLGTGKTAAESLKKSSSNSSFTSSDTHSSAGSLKGLIDEQVNKTFDAIKRGDELGPDPDSLAGLDPSDEEKFEKTKQCMKADLKALVDGVARLQHSRQHLVLAAWIQIQLAEDDKTFWLRKLHNDSLWGLARNQVQPVKSLLARLEKQDGALCYAIWYGLYKSMYAHVLSQDQLLPGCGNRRQILLPPDRLARKIPHLDTSRHDSNKRPSLYYNPGRGRYVGVKTPSESRSSSPSE